MTDKRKDNQHLKGQFQDILVSGQKSNKEETDQQYALASMDESIQRFKVLLRSGEQYSFPYALLPIYFLHDSGRLDIICFQLRISIMGRDLLPIEKALGEQRLKWVKESITGRDVGEADVFIERISVSGKAIEE